MVTDESPATRRAKLIGGYLGILAVLLLIGLPLFWILMTSFKAKGDIYTDPVNWLPPVWETENYSDATTRVPFWTYLRNSVLITAVLSIIKIVLGVISAYALAILRFVLLAPRPLDLREIVEAVAIGPDVGVEVRNQSELQRRRRSFHRDIRLSSSKTKSPRRWL